MKMITLVEDSTCCALPAEHGLSIYIETKLHKILFDLGTTDLFYKNAVALGIDLKQVDTVIISHGHDDHGGGLETLYANLSVASVQSGDAVARGQQLGTGSDSLYFELRSAGEPVDPSERLGLS